jgi:3'-phosphoadenosine 5'-phosphosulfate (PAPS) 3'-phosphatase
MLQTASFTGLFKVILIIALVYYGIKILSRIFAPYLVKYVAKKATQCFGQQFGQQQQAQQKQKEGEITIDKVPKTNATSNNNVGEYIDYEEVE